MSVPADRPVATDIHVERGEEYLLEAIGTWQDAGYPETDANGFKAFTAAMHFGTLLKPKPGHNYMKLCGKVGNWKFGIGSEATVSMKRSGVLTLFANDAKGFYNNNSGKLTVTVTRMEPEPE